MLTLPLTPTRFGKTPPRKSQSLEKIVSALPPVVYSTQPHVPTNNEPEGALVYIRTGQENDALAWIDRDGQSVTESQFVDSPSRGVRTGYRGTPIA